MVENIEPQYPPAEEPPPENAFDIQSFVNQVFDVAQERGLMPKAGTDGRIEEPSLMGSEKAELFFRILGHLVKDTPEILTKLMEGATGVLGGLLSGWMSLITKLLQPGMQTLGGLTHDYVVAIAGQGLQKSPAGLPVPGGPAKDATSVVFDQIMAPLLGLLTPSSPGKVGAGEENAQHILGTIISLHLSTWMINILSNLSGLGFLKFVNSFDDAVTAGISARGFSRMATRPYLDTFVVKPGTRDLNRRYPLELGSVAGIIKRYTRGNITAEDLKFNLKGKGYDDETVADLLLDNAKFLTIDDVSWLVKSGQWTDADGAQYLEQQGYPKGYSRLRLYREMNSRVESEYSSLASSLVAATIDRRLDNETLRYLLGKMGFSQEEVNAMAIRAATLVELNTPLTLAQVRDLYNEGIEPLGFVQNFLQDEGYSPDDVDRLVLLYFTKKEERDAVKAALADARRNRATAQAKQDQATLAAQQTESLLLG
jgi:hypothetical protein